MSENAPSNFEIPLEPARDRDSEPVTIKYSLLPMINDNNLDTSVAIEDTREYQARLTELNRQIRVSTLTRTQLSLIINEPFDYELVKEINFRIEASDQVGKSSFQYVKLVVQDVNDNLPIFDRDSYEYRLDESSAGVNTKLIRVHATDLDSGLNGQVKYSLVDQTFTINQQLTRTIRASDLFVIDSVSGWVSVGGESPLDYEQMSEYRLTVRAQDCGVANSMPVYTNVIVYLNDVNDNRPVINLTLPGGVDELRHNVVEVSEAARANSFLAQISVTDADSGENGRVTLELRQFKIKTGFHHLSLTEESDDFELVHLFNNIYSLMTKNPLDRETFDKYLIEVIARDNADLETVLQLQLLIIDENDNKPKFLENFYEFDVMEITDSKSDEWIMLGHVKAVDFDLAHSDSPISYSLSYLSHWCPMPNIQIDSSTGYLTAKAISLDRELCQKYEFKVTANDTLHQTEAKIFINLLDLNDSPPNFQKSEYSFQLAEGPTSTQKFVFGHVIATDLDQPNTSYSQVKYGIKGINTFFGINIQTGGLFQLKPLDYENQRFHQFWVVAFDNSNNSGNSLETECLVKIEVIDVNDNRPRFNFNHSIIIVNLNISDLKFHLNASDQDSAENGKLFYTIEKQIKLKQKPHDRLNANFKQHQYLNIFDCEPHSGVITLKPNQNRHKFSLKQLAGIYALLVKVTDLPLTSPSLNAHAIVFLNLDSANSTQLLQTITETQNDDTDLEQTLNKIVYAYSYAITNGKTLTTSQIIDKDSLLNLKSEFFRLAFSASNYKYFLVFVVAAGLMLCFIVTSLCMTMYFYKQRRQSGRIRKESKLLSDFAGDQEFQSRRSTDDGSTSSSTSLTNTKTTNSTISTSQNNNQSRVVSLLSASSVSPASTQDDATTHLFTTNYESLQLNYSSVDSHGESSQTNTLNGKSSFTPSCMMYDDEPNYSSVFKNKSQEKNQTLLRKKNPSNIKSNRQVAISNYPSDCDSIYAAERAILITSNNNEEIYNHSKNSNLTKNKSSMASSESLSSPQTALNAAGSPPSSQFRTFKTLNLTQSSPIALLVSTNQQQQQQSPYRTMPKTQPLNLPVNELFKRYELKRQAQDQSSIVNNNSNSSHSSLGSLTNTTPRLKQKNSICNV